MVPHRHDGQPGRAAGADLTRRRRDRSRGSHAVWHETGGSGANAGVQPTEIGEGGWFTRAEFEAAVKPRGHLIYPPTTLVEVENTHNRAGGVVVPQADAEAVANAARERGIASYLDGARLWNAAIVAERRVAELAAPFDVAMVSLSKGLGAPGGSIVATRRDLIPSLVRYRRMSGGAMRQVGIFAAAGLWALDHNLDRLAEDHANARAIATRLAESPAYVIDPATVDTNILVWQVVDGAPDAPTIVERARERGVLIFALGPRTFRAVTHVDVTTEQCAAAAATLLEAAIH